MSQQNLMEFLLYILCSLILIFALVIVFLEIKYSPEDHFYLEPLAKGFIKFLRIYLIFCFFIIIIFNLFF